MWRCDKMKEKDKYDGRRIDLMDAKLMGHDGL
jgi:hypothetical protein